MLNNRKDDGLSSSNAVCMATRYNLLISQILDQINTYKRKTYDIGLRKIQILEAKTKSIFQKCECKIIYTKNNQKLLELKQIKISLIKELKKTINSIEKIIQNSFKELNQISNEAASFFNNNQTTDSKMMNLQHVLSKDIILRKNILIKDLNLVISTFKSTIIHVLIYFLTKLSSEFLESELGFITEGHSNHISCVEISNSCNFLLTGSSDTTIRMWNLNTLSQKFVFRGHKHCVTTLAITKNEKLAISGSDDFTIIIWDIKKRCLKIQINLTAPANRIEIGYEDKYFLSLSLDGVLSCYDLVSFRDTHSYKISHRAYFFTLFFEKNCVVVWEPGMLLFKDILNPSHYSYFSIDDMKIRSLLKISNSNTFILIANENKIMHLYEENSKWNSTLRYPHGKKINDFVLASNDNFVLTVSDDCRLRMWDLQSHKLQKEFKSSSSPMIKLIISKDNNIAVTLSLLNQIYIWNITRGTCDFCIGDDKMISRNFRLADNGKVLIIGGIDGSINFYDIANKSMTKLTYHKIKPNCICLSTDKSLVATGSADKIVMVWKTITKEIVITHQKHTKSINCFDIRNDNKYIASGSEDKTIIICNIKKRAIKGYLKGHTGAIKIIAFLPFSPYIASAASDKIIIIWDIQKTNKLCTIKSHTGDIEKITFIDNFLVSKSKHEIIIWGINEKKVIYNLPIIQTCKIIATSRSYNLIAIETYNDFFSVWNIKNNKQVLSLKNYSIPKCLVITENLELIMPDEIKSTLIVYDMETNIKKPFLTGHSSEINSIVLMADETRIASGSNDKRIIIWSLISKNQIAVLSGHLLEITSLFLTTDGIYIASGSLDNTVRLWDIDSNTLSFEKKFGSSANSIAITSDNRFFFVGLKNAEVQFFDVERGTVKLATTFESAVKKISITINDKYAVSISSDSKLKVWNIKNENIEVIFSSRENLLSSFIVWKNNAYVPSNLGVAILRLKNMFNKSYVDYKKEKVPDHFKEFEFSDEIIYDCIYLCDENLVKKIVKENRNLSAFLGNYFYIEN